jgi:trehalose/maltose transport system substrate-binding protein
MIPGGPGGGVSRTLGGTAVAVSRYSTHRAQAVAALRYLISADMQSLRAARTGGVPTRRSLQQRVDLMANTPFSGPLAAEIMTGVVARPGSLAGESYDRVSRAYSEAVHSALTRQVSPDDALRRLESELVQITGFRPVRDPE